MSLGRYKAKLNLTIAGLLKQLGIENQPYTLKGFVYLDGTEPGFPTYTPAAGVRAIEVEVIGAGGGGGSANGQNTTDDGYAGGGGGGGWARAFITTLASSYTYAIGAGGAGGSSAGTNPGATGGTTSFTGGGVTIEATGGLGGGGVTSSSSNAAIAGFGGVGSLTGIAGFVGGGVQGTRSRYLSTANGICSVAYKGYCPLIGMSGVRAYGANSAGNATASSASLIGEGGNGAISVNTTSNYAGGAGFLGGIKITEYY